jgi:hypothetical protein
MESLFGRLRESTTKAAEALTFKKPPAPDLLQGFNEGPARPKKTDAKEETEETEPLNEAVDVIHRRPIARLPPFTEKLQKFILYETKARYYLVGSDCEQTRFRVLKIGRMQPHELDLQEDPTEYSRNELHSLLMMIQAGNRLSGGLTKVLSAYGVLGFVRFLHGYYIHFITQIHKAGSFGGHVVYAIEDTMMISIPHPSTYEDSKTPAYLQGGRLKAAETRYKALYTALDVTKNFYFSYSYDMTHTLQSIMTQNTDGKAPPRDMYQWNHFLLKSVQVSCV